MKSLLYWKENHRFNSYIYSTLINLLIENGLRKMTIKRLSKEYKEAMRDLWDYCFNAGQRTTDEDFDNYLKKQNLENCLGYFVDGKLASTYVIESYKMFVREVLMNMGGIAAVATFPEYRRQKQITALATESLKVMRENKQYISALYPFKYSFYRRYGYEVCLEDPSVITKPNNILLPKDFKPLKIKEISQEDSYEILKAFREKIGSKYNLIMYNDAKHWKTQYLNKKHKIYVVEEDGEIQGYFVTFLEKKDGPWVVRLRFRDILVANNTARLTVFDFIKKHTDQNKDVQIPLMGDESVFDYFDELWTEDVKYQIEGNAMFRVIDVKEAIKLLNFDKKLDFSFTLKVNDEYAPWNEEPLEITIKNSKAKVTKAEESTFDMQINIKAFTQLFVGYRDIYQLQEFNKVKISQDLVSKINQAFPKRYTRLRTGF